MNVIKGVVLAFAVLQVFAYEKPSPENYKTIDKKKILGYLRSNAIRSARRKRGGFEQRQNWPKERNQGFDWPTNKEENKENSHWPSMRERNDEDSDRAYKNGAYGADWQRNKKQMENHNWPREERKRSDLQINKDKINDHSDWLRRLEERKRSDLHINKEETNDHSDWPTRQQTNEADRLRMRNRNERSDWTWMYDKDVKDVKDVKDDYADWRRIRDRRDYFDWLRDRNDRFDWQRREKNEKIDLPRTKSKDSSNARSVSIKEEDEKKEPTADGKKDVARMMDEADDSDVPDWLRDLKIMLQSWETKVAAWETKVAAWETKVATWNVKMTNLLRCESGLAVFDDISKNLWHSQTITFSQPFNSIPTVIFAPATMGKESGGTIADKADWATTYNTITTTSFNAGYSTWSDSKTGGQAVWMACGNGPT